MSNYRHWPILDRRNGCKILITFAGDATDLSNLHHRANAALRFHPREVVHGLEVHPELGRGVECLREQPRRVRGHASLASNDFIDALHRDADMRREFDLREIERAQVLGHQYGAGMSGYAVSWNHVLDPVSDNR